MTLLENEMIRQIQIGDKQITLIGTAHVSRESADLVEETIRMVCSDTVSIELCESRYHILQNPEGWRKTDLVKIVREKKAMLLFVNLLLSSFQRRIAKKLGIRPGEEMMRAIDTANELHMEISLADRDIRTTLARSWRSIGLWKKVKLISGFVINFDDADGLTEEDVEKMKQTDVLESLLTDVGKSHPDLKRTLIDERDQYLAQKIKTAPGTSIVAVVGAGHLAGILQNIHNDIDLAPLETKPPPSKWGKIIKWVIPAVILGLIGLGFYLGGVEAAVKMIWWWVLANAIFAGLGAILAWAHPLTIVSAMLAAPITSLNPMIAAGWVAGLVEVSIRKPQVKDLDSLQEDILSFKGFWRNKVTRILLVVMLVNFGSSIGTFVALPMMLKILKA